jgi:hypothetical protein
MMSCVERLELTVIYPSPFSVWVPPSPVPLELVTRKKRNWKEYNEELVRRGELLFDPRFLSGWRGELERSNEGKEGAKYVFPSSLMSMLAAIHVYLLPYRQLEGFVRVFAENVKVLKEVPDYTTIWWRVAKVKVDIDPGVDRRKDVTIAVDSTGIKVSNTTGANGSGTSGR